MNRAAIYIRNEEIDNNENRRKIMASTFSQFCTRCSKAKLKEVIVSSEEFNIIDDDVKYLVGYNISCTKKRIDPYIDSRLNITCLQGDGMYESIRCSTCKYGKPRMIKIANGPKAGKATRWVNPDQYKAMDTRNLTQYRMVYECQCTEHSDKYEPGTYMSTYIRCDCYESAENTKLELLLVDVHNK